ncbi:MAG: transposase [Phoenicibacter congonensis]|uniref:Transposase n=1 Tax=Phoenicibacter congonensis TaxID=1944646 RepID=A0AA43RL55_9ACTN|nr:transposase [Phoenicibacter congonensis]
MLKHIQSFASYIDFLNNHFCDLSVDNRYRIKKIKSFKSAYYKLRRLNTDPIRPILFSLYAINAGRPAIDPVIFIRSFVLMKLLKYVSIDAWCTDLKHDQLLQFLVGTFDPPSVASHHDFINRIMNDNPSLKSLFPKGRFSKKNHAIMKKNEKWENYTDEDTHSLYLKYKNGAEFDRYRDTYTIERIFNLLAVQPSFQKGIIAKDSMNISGDGTCLHIHASPYGNKVEDAPIADINYRYSAPDANWGWDSDLEQWYFGFTIYNLTYHNKILKIDLPLYLTLGYASDHDALTSFTATARLLDIAPNLKPNFMCFDSAMDAAYFHQFLREKDIIPIIDWNKRNNPKFNPYAKYEGLNENGIPVCSQGHVMVRDGYDNSKKATKYRCPFITGKIDSCPLFGKCTKSNYGRVVKVYDKTNYKLFGPVPYHSDKWKEMYKNRTSTERINNRILNDYGLHKMHIRNRSKNVFFTLIIGICIHLDAWDKLEKSTE